MIRTRRLPKVVRLTKTALLIGVEVRVMLLALPKTHLPLVAARRVVEAR